MKQVKFARVWRDQVNATTVHEYPAGWSGPVSNETAERAAAADALDGAPKDLAPNRKPAKPKAKPTPKAKAVAAPVGTAPIEPEVQEPAPTEG